MKKIKLKVDGMHCKSCGMMIQDVLSDFEGIKKVDANYSTGVVEVSFDENKITENRIKIILKKEGYPAQ